MEKRRAAEEKVQDSVRPAILFGFFWVAMRRVETTSSGAR
jgi:hypothetical protein